jgi:hypothetical protein
VKQVTVAKEGRTAVRPREGTSDRAAREGPIEIRPKQKHKTKHVHEDVHRYQVLKKALDPSSHGIAVELPCCTNEQTKTSCEGVEALQRSTKGESNRSDRKEQTRVY